MTLTLQSLQYRRKCHQCPLLCGPYSQSGYFRHKKDLVPAGNRTAIQRQPSQQSTLYKGQVRLGLYGRILFCYKALLLRTTHLAEKLTISKLNNQSHNLDVVGQFSTVFIVSCHWSFSWVGDPSQHSHTLFHMGQFLKNSNRKMAADRSTCRKYEGY